MILKLNIEHKNEFQTFVSQINFYKNVLKNDFLTWHNTRKKESRTFVFQIKLYKNASKMILNIHYK